MTMTPGDPDYETRVRESFARQGLMTTLGAKLTRIAPGEIEIEMEVSDRVSQQHGFAHAGAVAAIADSACGYAAATLLPAGSGVLAVEFKINLMAPAAGPRLIARARVVRSGRTLTVCQADVYSRSEDEERIIAMMMGTIMNVRDRPGIQG
jgi:uncharacterized protein (TIGR00369 family)